MTTPRTLALSVAAALVIGLLVSQYLPLWRDEPGPRLRRECVSLVDTVLSEDHTVRSGDLEKELIKRGVNVPPDPFSRSKNAPGATEAEKSLNFLMSKEYEAEKKAYDAKWDEIKSTPAYNLAWEAVFSEKRSKAIKDCILTRARREGVSID